MSRRRILVRRGVLVAMVLASIVLLTGFFREGAGGPLHTMQAMVARVTAPVQSFTARAVEPLRDGWLWTTGLVRARDRATQLDRRVAVLEAQVIASRDQAQELAIARGLAGIRRELPDGYRRVPGQVIGKSVDNYYRRIRIDVGTAQGVVKNSPVVAARSPTQPVLVGIVVAAGPETADVSLVTDQGTEVGATVQGGAQVGVLRAVDNGQLLLDRVPREYRVALGSVVVTAGFSDSRLASLYPRGIAVGQVTSVGRQETDVNQSVQVSPLVDVRTLSDVVALAPVSALARRRASG